MLAAVFDLLQTHVEVARQVADIDLVGLQGL